MLSQNPMGAVDPTDAGVGGAGSKEVNDSGRQFFSFHSGQLRQNRRCLHVHRSPVA